MFNHFTDSIDKRAHSLVRRATACDEKVMVDALGSSYRHQIKDGIGVKALHLIEILSNHLKS